MTRDDLPPRRLLDSAGPVGDCVRQALVERELSVPHFARLHEKRLLRLRVQRAAWALSLAVAALVLLPKLRHETPEPSISAESRRLMPVEPLASASLPGAATMKPQPAPAAPPSAAPHVVAPPARKAPAVSARGELELEREATPRTPPSAAVQPAATLPSGGSAKACAELARSGAATEALGCYERLASGAGMSAELALFEQARLEGKVLRQPARALATLEAYRHRFPQGSLRAEVMLAQIEWLIAAGDSRRARALVDEALASGLLRERASELQRLRATLERDAAD